MGDGLCERESGSAWTRLRYAILSSVEGFVWAMAICQFIAAMSWVLVRNGAASKSG